jgi:hypothetical protein
MEHADASRGWKPHGKLGGRFGLTRPAFCCGAPCRRDDEGAEGQGIFPHFLRNNSSGRSIPSFDDADLEHQLIARIAELGYTIVATPQDAVMADEQSA